jgi:hypothetical protein
VIGSWGFDGAVEVGIAAFCAGAEPPADEEVWDRLTGAGVEPWPGGQAVVADSPAPLPDGTVAVRLFGLLVPADSA